MDTLFSQREREAKARFAPLAARMRPHTLEEFVGQPQAVGPGSWLRRAIEHDVLSSVILYGPAGTGKTTLARIVANVTRAEFVEVSAITGTVKDLRREVDAAEHRLHSDGRRTILFVDEIHRFNRSQQDALLHAVEDRVVVLVGATTENPYFEVNSALLSRSRVVELTALDDGAVGELVDRALASDRGLRGCFALDDEARAAVVSLAGGDGRAALTTLELAAQLASPDGTVPASVPEEGPYAITVAEVEEANPRRGLPYDKGGDMHYDVVSAFIKSMRGSDPDAVLYYLARMIESGEDPKFIARRIMIHACEDVGNADPMAIVVATAVSLCVERIGMPEGRIPLAMAATYIAMAPKSNAACVGIDAAMDYVRRHPSNDVPDHLRDAHYKSAKKLGHGVDYKYPHDFPGHWVPQQYLPDSVREFFYQNFHMGYESTQAEYQNGVRRQPDGPLDGNGKS